MEDAQLSAAQSGDEAAFRAITEPHRRELTVHCYRMLGSLSDADDAVQETWLRAWQGIARFEGRSALRAWLYKIATHVCLDALARRRARGLPNASSAPGDPHAPPPAPASEALWLEPLPDELIASSDLGPEARYTAREGVALALLAALEHLPGTQRAALLLRDVLGFSAKETAEILETSVASANSALQRARESIEQRRAEKPRRPLDRDDPSARDLIGRFISAWEAGDAVAVIALLKADAVFSMPPMPLWFEGREPIRTFLEKFLFAGDASDRFRVLPAAANGSAALAVYQRTEGGDYRFAALDVLVVEADGIGEIQAFLAVDPKLSAARFGLPDVL